MKKVHFILVMLWGTRILSGASPYTLHILDDFFSYLDNLSKISCTCSNFNIHQNLRTEVEILMAAVLIFSAI